MPFFKQEIVQVEKFAIERTGEPGSFGAIYFLPSDGQKDIRKVPPPFFFSCFDGFDHDEIAVRDQAFHETSGRLSFRRAELGTVPIPINFIEMKLGLPSSPI